MHVPTPIRISEHIGQDTPRTRLLEEILVLSKMNWNSAHLGGALPATLGFATQVGDILRELPVGVEPLPQIKFYM
jgi:hypothetical protein